MKRTHGDSSHLIAMVEVSSILCVFHGQNVLLKLATHPNFCNSRQNDVTKKKIYHWNLPYPPPHPLYCLPVPASRQQEVELYGIRVASHCHCQKHVSGCKRCHEQKIPCCRGGVKHQYKPSVQLVRLKKSDQFSPRTMEIFHGGRRRIYEYTWYCDFPSMVEAKTFVKAHGIACAHAM